jgi:hypothetical protein
MLFRLTFSVCSEKHMKHTNTLWCSMYIFMYTNPGTQSPGGFRGLITVVNYQDFFQIFCQELVNGTLFKYCNKLNTKFVYCGL